MGRESTVARLGYRPGVFLGAAALMMSFAAIPSGSASAAVSADLTPPVVDVVAGPAAVAADPDHGVPAAYTWSGHDSEASGPLTYDLRYGWRQVVGSEPAWQPGGLQDAPATTWTITLGWYDWDVCVEIRARDAAGNVSAWSEPRCTVVDNNRPWAYMLFDRVYTYGPTAHVHDGLASTAVSYLYGGSDDDQVASYDVDVRLVTRAGSYGPWTSPPSWQGTVATSVGMTAPAGSQLCFRARARDRAGRVSEYVPEWCKAVPYDDRDFRIHDGAKRVRRAGALGGTVTKMFGRHGSMTRRGEVGRHVWVRLTGGVPYACARVRFDGAHPHGCFIETVGGAQWQHFDFRRQRAGTLRIGGGMRVDAVAVIR